MEPAPLPLTSYDWLDSDEAPTPVPPERRLLRLPADAGTGARRAARTRRATARRAVALLSRGARIVKELLLAVLLLLLLLLLLLGVGGGGGRPPFRFCDVEGGVGQSRRHGCRMK